MLWAMPVWAQEAAAQPSFAAQRPTPAHARRARQFLRGRHGAVSAALAAARAEHAAMLPQTSRPRPMAGATGLSATWQPLGPVTINSLQFGLVTGRVTSIAVDAADATGNTVYVGTTGGGVWKSTNAAGAAASVSFLPLTDDLPVFSNNAGTTATASLSIGALSINRGILLAGTGDPNDATDSYYGGGLLRSTDGGLTWTLVQQSGDGVEGSHSWVGLAFAGFAWSTVTPDLVVAALTQSTEGDLVNASAVSTKGLYYSTDAGVTWQMSTIMDGSQPVQTPMSLTENLGGNAATSVVWDAARQRFYAAVRYHGYYQSADGGTWTRLSHQPATSLSLTHCPTDPGGTGNPNCPIFRGTLAVQPVTGDLFALTTDVNNLDQGLWQDVCGLSAGSCASSTVMFGTRLNSTPLEQGSGSSEIFQGDYDLALAAMPTTTGNVADTTLLVGTVDLYRCTLAGGCALRNTTNATNGCAAPAMVAPAQHAVTAAGAGAPGLLFVGNDGGLWRSTDGVAETGQACAATDALHFDNLNAGLGSLGETVSLAEDPANADVVLAGFGAMGTSATTSATSAIGSWQQISDGEGGSAMINALDPTQWTISTGAGVSLLTCGHGAICAAADFAGVAAIGPAQTSTDSSLFDEPSLLDPGKPGDVLVGTCRVWRGPVANGSAWSSANAISPPLAAQATRACTGSSAMIRALAAGAATGNADSPVIYAGMAGLGDGGGSAPGHLFATTTGGVGAGAWTDVALNRVSNGQGVTAIFNPQGFDVSSVAIDPHDPTGQTVYATVMGFSASGATSPHVYRSTNGGASWINITRNLPNAPANSIVVDPNDANTVYVAMDTGVYVTSTVTSCAAANCWSVFGSGLPNAPVTQLQAGANIPTGDGRTGELRAGTYGRGVWQAPLLTAAYPARPIITVSPTSLVFAAQSSGTASAAQTITVTNTGNATLNLSQLTTTGDFSETGTCATAALAVGASCSVQVAFLPTATGARSGVLTIYGNVAGGQATVALSGTGTTAASIVLTPQFLNFATTMIGSTASNSTGSAPFLTVSNTGGQPATLGALTVTGDFAIAQNTCGSTLASQTGCTLGITFTPTASGLRSGTLSLVTSAGTVTASLTGIGTAPATDAMSPMSLTFGTQVLNTASGAQTVTLTNSGDVALTLIAAQITAGDFAAVNTCGNSLNGRSSCTISVVFQPKNVGAETGVLSISDQYRTQTVALRGTGIAPAGVSLAPTSGLSFAATAVGTSSAAQTVALTNNGGLPLTITSLASSGDFGMAAGGTCGTTLGAGSSCLFQIVFSPTIGGARTGTFTVTSSAANSPHTLAMTGAGVDFSLTTNGSATASVTSGKVAGYPLLLSSVAGVPGTATLSCLGLPANTTCTISPASAALGSSTQVLVNVATGVSASAAARPVAGWSDGRGVVLAGFVPLGLLMLRRRRRLVGVMCGLVMVAVLELNGCGAGRAIPVAGTGGGGDGGSTTVTPSGSYSLTVNATSAGLTRSVPLVLVVK